MTQENVSNQGKGAIFDLDGTLLDSMGVWDKVDVDFRFRQSRNKEDVCKLCKIKKDMINFL